MTWAEVRSGLKPQYEHMFSALPSNSDVARRSRHVSNVPTPDIERIAAGHAAGWRVNSETASGKSPRKPGTGLSIYLERHKPQHNH